MSGKARKGKSGRRGGNIRFEDVQESTVEEALIRVERACVLGRSALFDPDVPAGLADALGVLLEEAADLVLQIRLALDAEVLNAPTG